MEEGTRERLIALRDIKGDDLEEFARTGLVEAIEGSREVELAYMLGRLDQRLASYVYGSDTSQKVLRGLLTRSLQVGEVPTSADDYEDPVEAARAAAEAAGAALTALPTPNA